MVAWSVEALDDVTIAPGSPLDAMDLMSPFVWREDGVCRIMLRGVPHVTAPDAPTGIIAAGQSRDGLTFTLDPVPAIAPGRDPADHDAGGCEDPTVVLGPEGYRVYYTGVDAARRQGCMMLASGPTLDRLHKRAVVIKAPLGEGNIKEATLVDTSAGERRLFYEYAQANASRIGIAALSPDGESWASLPDPFGIREDGWDNWHLSTGPVVTLPGMDPVMFYNGATVDARWHIGWIMFDRDFTRVTARGIEPLLMPPPAPARNAVDIAFAASAVVEDDLIMLYYSLRDRVLRRATVRAYR